MSDRRPKGVGAWLALAAAPVFALMALLTLHFEADMPAAICSGAGVPFPLAGMAPMYLLMATFHLVPWLKLTAHG